VAFIVNEFQITSSCEFCACLPHDQTEPFYRAAKNVIILDPGKRFGIRDVQKVAVFPQGLFILRASNAISAKFLI
jgi:hypothetical protein